MFAHWTFRRLLEPFAYTFSMIDVFAFEFNTLFPSLHLTVTNRA